MTIFAAFLGQMIGGFLGRVLCEWLFRERTTRSPSRGEMDWYQAGFYEGYRLGKMEEDE